MYGTLMILEKIWFYGFHQSEMNTLTTDQLEQRAQFLIHVYSKVTHRGISYS